MTETGDGVYSAASYTSDALTFQFYSNDFEKLTDYNLKVSIAFTYPQTAGTMLNITPFYRLTSGSFTYLGQIGKIYANGNNLPYHTKQYYDDGQPNIAPFTHGGYYSTLGGSNSTINVESDLTYYFGENINAANIGLYFETGNPGSLSKFPSSQREITVTVEYFDAVEKATIENAETTKNIFEWLQDGFVKLIVPTSDGIEEMIDKTSSTFENRLGILYTPIEFTGQLLGSISSALENADSGQSINVPAWNIALPGHTYTMWHQFSFSITDNAIFHHITTNSTSLLLLRIVYVVCLFLAIFKTIDVLSDGMYDDEFVEIVTDNGEE